MSNSQPKNHSTLEALFAVPREQRDEQWQDVLVEKAAYEVCASDAKPVKGPDGFLYIQLSCISAAREDQPRRICIKDELPLFLEHGAGAVLFSHSESAEWIFTSGDLLNFKLSGRFYSALAPKLNVEEAAEEQTKVSVAQPSESYLPGATRTLLRNWLAELQIQNVRLHLMDYPQNGEVLRYLVFDFSQSGKADEELPMILYGVSWFLPRHYLVLGSNDPNEDRTSFEPL